MPDPIESIDRRIRRTVELTKRIEEEYLGELFATGEKKGHTFEISLYRDGNPVSLSGYSVEAEFIRPDKLTLIVQGAVSSSASNTAVVSLDKECYDIEGEFTVSITVFNNNVIKTVYHAKGSVVVRMTNRQGSSTVLVPDLTDIRGEINAMREAAAMAQTVINKSVRFDTDQDLTDQEKEQARENIAALSYEAQTLTEAQKVQARQNIGASDEQALYDEPKELTAEQKAQARANIGAVSYETQELTEAQKAQARQNIGASDGAVLYKEAQNLSATQKTQARENIGAVSYESQTLTEAQKAQARQNIGASDGAVLYKEAQELTAEQKAQARGNIGAVSYESQTLNTSQKAKARGNIGAVSYESQTLTEAQKAQARQNIGASDGAVLYKEAQNLTEAQKAQARRNIGASDGAVLYKEAQNLTEAQKAQARQNIGATDGDALYNEALTLTDAQKTQARENIGAQSASEVTTAIDNSSVQYSKTQNLDSTQKARARTNIGAASAEDLRLISEMIAAGLVSGINATSEGLEITYTDGTTDIVENGNGNGIANVVYDSGNYLHFYDANGGELFDGPFLIQGGGGGTGYSVRIINGLSSTTVSFASTQTAILPFTYVEYYGGDVTNENGYLTVRVKLSTENEWRSIITNQQIPNNRQQTLDVTELLTEGATTNILIICSNGRTDEDAVTKTLQFNVKSVEMSITSTFNQTATYNGNFNISYTCFGRNLTKIVHCTIDGVTYRTENVGTSHNQALQMAINMAGNYTYGSHTLRLWFETEDGAESNTLEYFIMYDDGTSQNPIICASLANNAIENGETIYLNYMCYTPGRETTEAISIRVYAEEDGGEIDYYTSSLTNVANNTLSSMPISRYPDNGAGFIELVSGVTTVTLAFTVRPVQSEYDITPVTAGLCYSYRPTGYTNNSADKETYVYTFDDAAGNERNVYTRMTNFNWVTDGYLDGQSITISGNARMRIDLPILSTAFTNADNERVVLDAAAGATVTTSGRTIEFEFELDNVTNQNSVVFSCLDNNGVGFVITPQVCYILADGQAPILDSTGFIENEESIPCAYIKDEKCIRVSFVIEPASYSQDGRRFTAYTNVYINGEYANSYLYDPGAYYNSEATITIGSPDCVTHLYEVRMYNRGLTRHEVLRSTMNAPIDIRERIANNEFNDVLNINNDVDYCKARLKYPCLLFIGELSNFKADKKYVGVVLTKPDGLGSYTTEFSLLERDTSNKFLCSIKVQGTTSQRFMRKNFKVYLVKFDRDGSNEIILDDQGKQKTKKLKYVLKGYDDGGNPLSIGESTLCFKADYMSTDHANTFNANIADTLFNDRPAGSLVQDTIYGFRCLLFNMPASDYVPGVAFEDYPEGTIAFAGDGCLNNDKSNTKTFGLETEGDDGNVTTQQKWEFKDNSNPLCTFKTDRLMLKVYNQDGETYKLQARNGLESCYPDEGDLDDAGIDPNYSYIQVLFTWVYQRANFWEASTAVGTGGSYNGITYNTARDLKKAIFKNEFTRHFNLEHALVYYLFIEFVALCDNRAKNMFLSCKDVTAENLVFTSQSASTIWDCVNMETGEVDESKINWNSSTFGIWYTDLYDLDSCFGAENSGYIRIPYFADWNYQLGRTGTYQFNGHDSRLWCMFEEAFADEIMARAKLITRNNTGFGALNYGVLKDVHITNNAEFVCPAVVNRDMVYKYEDAWTVGYWDYSVDPENPSFVQTNAYKYLQRGSRTEQKESFIYRRSMMLYSKYQCDQFINDRIAFRCDSAVAKDDTEITVAAVQAMWLGVTFGDSGSPVMSGKLAAGETATLSSPNNMGRSDNVYIHGASNLTSISSLAAFHPYEIGLTNAGKLKTLLIGSDEPGYNNGGLSALDTSACVLLDTLNVQGCTGFTDSPINLSNNTLIRVVLASGSTVPYFTFGNGGILETLELGTPKRIVVLNMHYMQNFSYDSLDALAMLRVENTPNMHVLDIIAERLTSLRLGLRLIGINETVTGTDFSVFKLLTSSAAQGKRLDANGNLVNDPDAWPEITGVINCEVIGSITLDLMNTYYPNLTINAAQVVDQYTVSFMNADGTTIKDAYGRDYVQQIDRGSSAYDPVNAGEIEEPTIAPDAQYTYTFSGWDGLSGIILSNKTVTATYSTQTREYTVRWFAKRNDTNALKVLTGVPYGTEVKFNDDPHVFPELDDEESVYIYDVFTGWDKSTGFIVGDTDVYAIWEKAALPAEGEKELKDMSVAEIKGVAKNRAAASYWNLKDYIDIKVGRDFEFTNVESRLLASELYLDGNTCIRFDGHDIDHPLIKLLDENGPDFTLAIDYEFTTTVLNSTLVSAYEEEGYEGFRLRYNGNPDIQWGDKNQAVGYNCQRGIVVIRRRKGSSSLYVATNGTSSGTYSDGTLVFQLSRTRNTTSDAVLAFGGVPVGTTGNEYSASGWIHWCKIWYADLGNTAVQQLATWTHETWRMEFAGAERYRLTDGSGERCSASFVANALTELRHVMNNNSSNTGGWDSSTLRSFTNGKVFNALPYSWQSIIKLIRFNATQGNNTSDVIVSDNKVYLPAYSEMYSVSYNPYVSEGTLIPWFVDNKSRVKFNGLIIPEDSQLISEINDPTGMPDIYQIKEGDIWYKSNSSYYYYIYMPPEKAAKHVMIGSIQLNSSANIDAFDGGKWICASTYWLRTAYANNTYYFYAIYNYGSTTTYYASNSLNLLIGFSI